MQSSGRSGLGRLSTSCPEGGRRFLGLLCRPGSFVFQKTCHERPDVFGHVVNGAIAIDHLHPVRFRTGTVELRPDEERKAKMSGADKNLVTALTAPLLLKYGYLGRKQTAT